MDWQDKQSLKDLYLIAYPIVFGIAIAAGVAAAVAAWLLHS